MDQNRNYNTANNLELKNYFEGLSIYQEKKVLLLVKSSGEITYLNGKGEELLKLKKNESIFTLNSEPRFEIIFKNLENKKVAYFNSELTIDFKAKGIECFHLNIDKVSINNLDLYLVILDELHKRTQLNSRVNSYNQALESVSVGVLIAGENQKIQYISTAFEKMFNTRLEVLYQNEIAAAFTKYLSIYELDELKNSVINNKNWAKIITDYDNEGNVSFKEIRLNILENKLFGANNYIVTAYDITNQVQQKRRLKRTEQRQKSIINNIFDPILILKKIKSELYIEIANNNFFTEILKRVPERIEEDIKLEKMSPVLHSIIHEAILNLESSNRLHSQFHYTSPLSNKRFLGKISFTDNQYDSEKYYIINMTDITEQLEVERKLREAYNKEISLNKLKSTFLANMSHEIRTPLNAIVGYSDLLEDDVKEMNVESSTKMTSYLKDGVNRLLRLVDNIVEVSLLESGNEDIKLNSVSLNQLIKTSALDWTEVAKSKQISIELDLFEEEIYVHANEEKLARALKELVDNAIKYNIEDGKVYINTKIERNKIILQISDTGIGIDNEGLNRIFNLFEQAEDAGYTRTYDGAGLGLSLANKLVSFMNGKMEIVSQPKQGTIITITFPKFI